MSRLLPTQGSNSSSLMVIGLISRKTLLFLLAPDWPATRHHFQTHCHCGPMQCGLERMKSSTVIDTSCGVIAILCVRSKSTRTLGTASRCGTWMAPRYPLQQPASTGCRGLPRQQSGPRRPQRWSPSHPNTTPRFLSWACTLGWAP
jgi:hypothetical protein